MGKWKWIVGAWLVDSGSVGAWERGSVDKPLIVGLKAGFDLLPNS
jgi:hypothetical protein